MIRTWLAPIAMAAFSAACTPLLGTQYYNEPTTDVKSVIQLLTSKKDGNKYIHNEMMVDFNLGDIIDISTGRIVGTNCLKSEYFDRPMDFGKIYSVSAEGGFAIPTLPNTLGVTAAASSKEGYVDAHLEGVSLEGASKGQACQSPSVEGVNENDIYVVTGRVTAIKISTRTAELNVKFASSDVLSFKSADETPDKNRHVIILGLQPVNKQLIAPHN
ncbi:hypothetical protein [Insolitispirillum peregrinum]|uniref:Lipoprotein n=1 Tax=Insolitispirillum peregrinum TaxID=80876 RepID=A0A1N7LCF4_9PROT|nr:hypothetical protein [Insolitispirillum peregrinum]SIS71545.1 hypothetical protein SAMN05421779_103246 [Insolitispirillum peregrinum]